MHNSRDVSLLRSLVFLAALLMPVAMPVSASEESPQVLIRSVTTSVLDTLRAGGKEYDRNQPKLVALIEEQVLPYFDFRLMSAQVLGRYWRTASEQQRGQFTEAFRQLLTNTYAAVFGRYEGQTVAVLGEQNTGRPDRVMVYTTVKSPGKADVRVDYRLYNGNGKWRIYDVVADGISLLINYRTEYASVLAHNSMDSLITRLNEKNAQFQSSGK
jgi:phospholipid transport system substrate-binding protein